MLTNSSIHYAPEDIKPAMRLVNKTTGDSYEAQSAATHTKYLENGNIEISFEDRYGRNDSDNDYNDMIITIGPVSSSDNN